QVDRQLLDARVVRVTAELRRSDAVELAVLVRGDEPALRIMAERDPRALRLGRHRVEQFDLEVLLDLDQLDRRGGRLLELAGLGLRCRDETKRCGENEGREYVSALEHGGTPESGMAFC